MEKKTISVLLIDDDEDYYLLTQDLLEEIPDARFKVSWVQDYQRGVEAILTHAYDICLVDYRLGSHYGVDLIKEATHKGCTAPLLLLTGQGDREVDLQAMTAGAADYLDKGKLDSQVLERSIRYAMERNRLINELRDALDKIKTLKGLVPICAHCKKIRDDNGYWNQLELYIEEHSGAEFSHGLCPDCIQELYPDVTEKKDRKG